MHTYIHIYNQTIRILINRAAEVAQLVKCLACKHKDLNLISSILVKIKRSEAGHTYYSGAMEAETKGSQEIAGVTAWLNQQASGSARDPVYNNKTIQCRKDT